MNRQLTMVQGLYTLTSTDAANATDAMMKCLESMVGVIVHNEATNMTGTTYRWGLSSNNNGSDTAQKGPMISYKNELDTSVGRFPRLLALIPDNTSGWNNPNDFEVYTFDVKYTYPDGTGEVLTWAQGNALKATGLRIQINDGSFARFLKFSFVKAQSEFPIGIVGWATYENFFTGTSSVDSMMFQKLTNAKTPDPIVVWKNEGTNNMPTVMTQVVSGGTEYPNSPYAIASSINMMNAGVGSEYGNMCSKDFLYRVFNGGAPFTTEFGTRITIGGHEFVCVFPEGVFARLT